MELAQILTPLHLPAGRQVPSYQERRIYFCPMKWFLSLQTKQKAIIALILANLIWGAASPIFKWSLGNIPLFTLAYFRFFIASFFILPFALKRSLVIEKKDWLSLFLMSFFGITLNITFFFLGLEYTASINAPIIASAGPVFLLIAAFLVLHEKPKRKTLAGTLISLLGVLVIIGRPLFEKGLTSGNGDTSSLAFLGNVFFVVATLGAVGHTIIGKELARKYSAFTLTFWAFLIGSIGFFPLFVRELFINGGWTPLDIRGILGLVFGILLSSGFAYLAYHWAIEKLPASETGVFTYIDPLAATLIALPLLGEIITPLFVLGSIFVFAGIFVAEGRINYHPFHKLRSLH